MHSRCLCNTFCWNKVLTTFCSCNRKLLWVCAADLSIWDLLTVQRCQLNIRISSASPAVAFKIKWSPRSPRESSEIRFAFIKNASCFIAIHISRNGMNATVTQMWTHRALYSHINHIQSRDAVLLGLFPHFTQIPTNLNFCKRPNPPNYTDLLKMHVNVQPVHRMALCHPLKEKSHMAPTNGLLSPNPLQIWQWLKDGGGDLKPATSPAFSFNCLNILLDVIA